ncbi:MAG: hypothetical protein N2Z72_04495 [Bacteroidales bacterium]|nr:hypothetical protein [Bacteroidales bacterium]
MRTTAGVFVLFFIAKNLTSQYYITGQDKASTKWYQVKTSHFHIIFPESYKKHIQSFANTSEKYYHLLTKTISWENKTIPVVLFTNSVVPNAFSLWTPERTEFYMTPAQHNYGQAWYKQLIIHEYRHLLQMDKLNQGLTKFMTYFIGQHATAITMGLFMPMWYMEGDAVMIETSLSQTGRGRLPSFESKMKAFLLENQLPSFDQMSLGSWKRFIPDQYYFGYYFVAQSYAHYGEKLWDNAINTSAKRWYLLSPLNVAFRKQTGMSKSKLYEFLFSDLQQKWKKLQDSIKSPKYTPLRLAKQPRVYTHYKFPIWINDSTIVAEKSGMEDLAKIVKIDLHSGKEKTIHSFGFFTPDEPPTSDMIPLTSIQFPYSPGAWTLDNFSRGNRYICWAEKKWHPRWHHVSYSVIKILDLQTQKVKQITRKTKYFSPSLSQDDSLIVAIEFTSDQQCSIVIIESKTGNKIQHFPLPAGHFAMLPCFSPNKKQIVCITQRPDIKQLEILDLKSEKWTKLLSAPYEDIHAPYWYGDSIFFTASFDGNDNIYVFNLIDSSINQITEYPYAAYHPHLFKDKVLFDGYTSKGTRIFLIPKDSLSNIPLSETKKKKLFLEKHYVDHMKKIWEDTLKIQDSFFVIKPYRKFSHLFHFHSWIPFYPDMENNLLLPGIKFLSQDLLSTSITELAYHYRPYNQSHTISLNYAYAGWFPVINLLSEWKVTRIRKQQWFSIHNTAFTLSLPLRTTINSFCQSYKVSLSTGYQRMFMQNSHSKTSEFIYASGEILFSNHQKIAPRQFAPHWRQDVNIYYQTSIQNTFPHIRSWELQTRYFFPSVSKLHSIQMSLYALQREYTSFPTDYRIFQLARGYPFKNLFKAYTIGVSYYMPMFYPDLPLGSILYIKRIRLGMFYDYTEGKIIQKQNLYLRSTGTEWLFDVHLFRFFLPLELGYRISYLMDGDKPLSHQVFLGINFTGW